MSDQDRVGRTAASIRACFAAAAAVLAIVLLAGCSAGAGGEAAGAAPAQPASAAQCARLLGQPAQNGAGVLVVVVDATRSRGRQAADGLPSAARAVIEQASLRRQRVSVLAVDGRGAAPRWLVRDASLNYPDLPGDVAKVRTAAARAPSCIASLGAEAEPTRPGTDLAQAFRAVAESRPDGGRFDVVAITDGLSTTGDIDLDGEIATEPADVAVRSLVKADEVVPMRRAQVLISGVGRVDGTVVPLASSRWLRAFWSGWCAATGAVCTVPVTDQGVTPSAARERGPADPLPPLPSAMLLTAEVGFAGDSARLEPGDEEVLAPVVACVSRARGAVRLDGHVQPTGASPEADLRLARARARSVAMYLARRAHLPMTRFALRGHLPGEPVRGRPAEGRVVLITVDGGC